MSLDDAEVGHCLHAANHRAHGYLELLEKERQQMTPIVVDCTKLSAEVVSAHGKTKDLYFCGDFVVMVSTDRMSAFDRQLAAVPFKGAVTNLISGWWFERTHDIVPNHVVTVVHHPNVSIVKRCTVFPVEFVMRGYITGSTSTSMWTHYNRGERDYCGYKLSEGLTKNQKLPQPLLTPTTKGSRDELTSAQASIAHGNMSAEEFEECAVIAHKLFRRGQELSAHRGLILVDTKYEFGKDSEGNIVLVDELHTPDSSRYWIAETYRARISRNEVVAPRPPIAALTFGQEPVSVDAEFLRLWATDRFDPHASDPPTVPPGIIDEQARRNILLFEVLTGSDFKQDVLPLLNTQHGKTLRLLSGSAHLDTSMMTA